MDARCPRCFFRSKPLARFCGHCGLALVEDRGGYLGAPRLSHPQPLQVPPGYRSCGEAADLYYRTGGPWGGAVLLGTEGLSITLFNAGYDLQNVVLSVTGYDAGHRSLFTHQSDGITARRGEPVTVDVPSYEVPCPPADVSVSVESAEFAPEN